MADPIKKIAYQVRFQLISDRYPDSTLDWVRRVTDYLDLCGECAIGSQRLFKALQKRGYEDVWLCLVENHVYVRVGEVAYDITATQFGKNFPPVYVFEGERGHGPVVFESDNIEEFQTFLKDQEWPPEQIFEEFDTTCYK